MRERPFCRRGRLGRVNLLWRKDESEEIYDAFVSSAIP
jgi:hypothetical protein